MIVAGCVMLTMVLSAGAATLDVPASYATLQDALTAAAPSGDTIQMAAGTYTIASGVVVNKAVTIQGAGIATILEVSGTGYRFSMLAAGAAIKDLQIKKTDKTGGQDIIWINASNVTIQNNLIWGQFVLGDGEVSRAMVISGGNTGLLIDGNTIHNLRQPAYISGPVAGTVSNNYVYATKGWVIEQGDLAFTNNTWGTGAQANYMDIAILPTVAPGYYTDIAALSAANNGAVIQDQRPSPRTLSVAYVDASAAAGGDGTVTQPFKTIAEGISGVVPGGKVIVAPGTYPAALSVTKAVTLCGANAGVHPAVGTHPTETVGTRVAETILSSNYPAISPQADNITVDGFMFTGDGGRIIDTYANANNFHLTNCIFDNDAVGTTQGVIQFGGGSHTGMRVDFNLLQDRGDHTLYFGGGPFDGLQVSYNRINVEGDSFFWAATPLVDGVIRGNEFDGTISGVPGVGFGTINMGQGGNVLIENNWFHDMQYTPMQVGIIGGAVQGNTFERIYAYPGLGADVMQLWGGQWGTAVSTDVTIQCNQIGFNDVPAATLPTHGLRLRAPESGPGIDGTTIHVHNNIFKNGAVRSDAFAIRHQGNAATAVDADNNWWGGADDATVAALLSGNVDYTPVLTSPPDCLQDLLYLQPTPASIYVKPSETVTVDMSVANLSRPVTACQALLNFSSSFFKTGSGEVTVAKGGGVWDELIYSMWDVDGDLDVAVGVELVLGGSSTQADGKVAYMVLQPTGIEGTTRVVFRPDVDDNYATFFSDVSNQALYPNKLDSVNIVIDGTAPADFTVAPSTICTKTSVDLTFSTTDALSGVDHYELFVDTVAKGTIASVYTLDLSGYADGAHSVVVRAIDRAGNTKDSPAVTVNVDKTAPVIAGITALQNGSSVICPAVALQGTVDIYVDASDAGCAGITNPTVTVAGVGDALLVGSSGSVYHYQITIGSAVVNGSHVITVVAADGLGTSVTDATQAICVDKNQITGQIELQNFAGTSRAVTFVATNGATVVKTWTLTLTGWSSSKTTYTLTNVPDGITGLSAKTAWNLRRKLTVSLDGDGQATADFIAGSKLLGGDINGDNFVNVLDYSVMKSLWLSPSPIADIDGNGSVGLADYTIMKSNWFVGGNPQ